MGVVGDLWTIRGSRGEYNDIAFRVPAILVNKNEGVVLVNIGKTCEARVIECIYCRVAPRSTPLAPSNWFLAPISELRSRL